MPPAPSSATRFAASREASPASTGRPKAPPWRSALRSASLHDPPRVLVAEDDPEMRKLVVEALRKDGHEVQAVADGGQLLAALARGSAGEVERADLVVSDVRMPVCSGLRMLEQVRAACCRVPVILMTAFADSSTREQAGALDAVLLEKPFDLDDLRTAATSLLRRA